MITLVLALSILKSCPDSFRVSRRLEEVDHNIRILNAFVDDDACDDTGSKCSTVLYVVLSRDFCTIGYDEQHYR